MKNVGRLFWGILLMGSVILESGCSRGEKPRGALAPTVRPALIPYEYSSGEITGLCAAAMERAKSSFDQIAALPHETRNFQNTVEAMEQVGADVREQTDPLIFMAYVSTNEALREEGAACEEKMAQFGVEVSLRKDLYEAFDHFRQNLRGDFSSLTAPEQRLVELTARDYRKNGLHLPGDKLDQLRELKKELATLETEFSTNLVENTDFIIATEQELDGTPELFRDRLTRTEDGNFKVTVKPSDYVTLMENTTSEDVRRRMFIAYSNRESPENTRLLERAIRLRHQIATLLGYNSWADYRTDNRMARNAENVSVFLNSLKDKLALRNREELQALLALKRETYPDAQVIEQWDRPYYSNQLKKRDYQIDDEEIRQYFPAHRVIQGTFAIYSRLLDIEFREVTGANVWHSNVKLFEIRDRASRERIGYFYADLYPREGKYGHAAAFSLRSGRALPEDGSYQDPVSAIVANINPPSENIPSLMSHDEVETFFHEFGHIMHQTLTRAAYASFSGTSVTHDFVEAPSQMFENWVWNADMLDILSGHYQDENRKLPPELRQKLLASSLFNSGIFYTRQLYYALLDLTLHTSGEEVNAVETTDRLCLEITGLANPPDIQWIAGFGHLMGGYDAGYYGYLWSEVYAQDMFSKFESEGLLSESLGRRYRQIILERGGSQEPSELIVEFLGRESNPEAFFRKLGISSTK